MGAKTLGTIIDEGMTLGNRDDADCEAWVLAWVNNWLRQTYMSWDYPFLHRSREALSLAAGTTSLDVGAGQSGITIEIQRVLDPIWVYKSDYSYKGQARIRQLIGGNDTRFEDRIQDTTVNRGAPIQVRVRPHSTTYGRHSLIFLPVPDAAYLLAFDYIGLPANLVAADTPIYPNDSTLVQAALAATHLFADGQSSAEYKDALVVLSTKVTEDKARFGATPGVNDLLPLDGGVFR